MVIVLINNFIIAGGGFSLFLNIIIETCYFFPLKYFLCIFVFSFYITFNSKQIIDDNNLEVFFNIWLSIYNENKPYILVFDGPT